MPDQQVGKPSSIRFKDPHHKRIVAMACSLTGKQRQEYIADAAVAQARQDLKRFGIDPDRAIEQGAMAYVA